MFDRQMTDWPEDLVQRIEVQQIGASEHRAPKNPEDLAPTSFEDMRGLIRGMPNPAECEHSDWAAVNLAIQGAIRGGVATGVLTDEQADEIKDEAAAWSARWEGANPSDFQAERAKWDDDWSTRDNDVSGWRNLIGYARQFGADVSAYTLTLTQAEFAAVPLPPDEPEGPLRPARIRLLTPSDCEAQPGRAYVIKGLLAEGDLACIFGPPGAGKSIAAPHIGYAVAQGRLAFGMRTKPGEVFYVAAEDTHGMRQRTRALKLVNGDAPGFLLVEGVSNLLDDAQLAELRGLVRSRRPKLVFIDTVAMSFPGIDENGSADMGKVVTLGRKLAETGAAVVLIHHDTKAGSNTPRGHGLLNGALDVSIQLTGDDTTKIVSGRLMKNRNGPCDRTLAFSVKSERIGVDEDGDTVTAPTAHELTAEAARTQGVKLPPTAKAAYAILQDMPTDDTGGVLEAEWRDACDDQRISASKNPKGRARVFRRAFQELRDRNLVAVGDNRVWLKGAAVGDFPIADLRAVETAAQIERKAADERAAKSTNTTEVANATKATNAASRTKRTKRGPKPANAAAPESIAKSVVSETNAASRTKRTKRGRSG